MTIVIRTHEPEDTPSVRTHLRISWRETYAPIIGPTATNQLLSALQSEDLGGLYGADDQVSFVATLNDQIIGTSIGASRYGVAYIWGMYVQEAHQRRGIGSKLLRAALEQLQGSEMVELWVLQKSEGAQAFYANLGFEKTGEVVSEMAGGVKQPMFILSVPFDTVMENLG
jgi:ribosomal protein S18 acetylase RimI-like enzyme